MKRTTLAFLGLAFLIYWFATSDAPSSQSGATLDLVVPASVTPAPPHPTNAPKRAKAPLEKIPSH